MIPTVFGLGTQELMLIFLVILIFFGAKKIPEMARGLGKGVSEFKKGMNDLQSEMNKEEDKEEELKRREADLARREAELQKRLEQK
jgi:sec-independent protein translocase protein TatA